MLAWFYKKQPIKLFLLVRSIFTTEDKNLLAGEGLVQVPDLNTSHSNQDA